MKRVAVVCSGNICRSFMAEKVFTERIPGVEWISAGVAPHEPGADADPDAIRALRRRGYTDTGPHNCRGISNRLLASDLLLVMEDRQRTMLVELGCPKGRVRLLTEFDPAAPYEQVANPWGLPEKIYDDVLTLIERCVPRVRWTVAP